MEDRLKLSLRNRMDSYDELNYSLAEFLKQVNLPGDKQYAIKLALEELMQNTIEHAPEATQVDITIECTIDSVTICFENNGDFFDPNTTPELAVEAPLESRSVGGMGIHLIKTFFNSMTYERLNETNRLHLLLKLT